MDQLTNQKTMTVKEVAVILNVSRQLVSEKVKELFPEIVKNGIETKLNEKQVTTIKLNIEKNQSLPSTIVEGMPKTHLEKKLIVAQAIQILNEEIEELKKENIEQKNRINLLIHDNKTYTSSEIAKELNIKSAQELNRILSEKGIQYKVNGTWVLHAKYSGEEFESIKQQELDNGKIIYHRHWTGRGRDFILHLFNITNNLNPV